MRQCAQKISVKHFVDLKVLNSFTCLQAPIIDGIYRVLYEKADPAATVEEVMSRALHAEIDQEMHQAAKDRS